MNETIPTWSKPVIVFAAPDEPMDVILTSGRGPDQPREAEQMPDGRPHPAKPNGPEQDQSGPASPDPDYLPEGPKDPLPHVWPAEPETQ
jgi:hypothetical protein